MAWPTSPRWRPALAADRVDSVTRIEVLEPSGALATTLTVTGGSVDIDATGRESRRQATLDVSRDVISAVELLDLLDPRSRRLVRCWRGVQYAPGDVELVPIFTGHPKRPHASSDLTQTMQVECRDPARRLARAKWTHRFPIAAGTNANTAIAAIIADRAPWLAYDLDPTDVVLPAMWLGLDPTQSDPWQDIRTIALAAAKEALFDPMGQLVTRPVADPATTPVTAELVEGAHCTLHRAERDLDDEQTYNMVILTAEGSGIPVPLRSEAKDTDPGSPTFVDVYGEAPLFATTNIGASQAANDAACQAMLLPLLGLTEQATIEFTPDPSLDGGDILRVTESRTGLAGLFILDTGTVPLGVGDAMTGGLRERRIA